MERYGSIESVLRAEIVELGAALDAEREKVKELEEQLRLANCDQANTEADLNDVTAQLATLQAQLVRWKEALGEWLWNCTNLLGDYHIKTVQDFNEEVNRRIAWLMEHLDHTLPPPMTDEERDRMQKLSEGNAALQADNECKDSLIETLQARLRQVEGENELLKSGQRYMALEKERDTLRQLVEAFVQHFDSDFENPGLELYGRVNGGEISNGGKGLNELLAKARATLAAQDAGKA